MLNVRDIKRLLTTDLRLLVARFFRLIVVDLANHAVLLRHGRVRIVARRVWDQLQPPKPRCLLRHLCNDQDWCDCPKLFYGSVSTKQKNLRVRF